MIKPDGCGKCHTATYCQQARTGMKYKNCLGILCHNSYIIYYIIYYTLLLLYQFFWSIKFINMVKCKHIIYQDVIIVIIKARMFIHFFLLIIKVPQ